MMSYARWGQDGSSVYVYRSIVDDPVKTPLLFHCCCCTMVQQGWCGFYAHSWAEMIAHLEEHRERGDCVPDYVFEALKREETR